MFGAEVLVGEGDDIADAEAAIQLVQGGRAKGAVRRCDQSQAIGRAVQRGEARTPRRLAAVFERDRVMMRIEVAPRIESQAGRDSQIGCHGDDVVDEYRAGSLASA